MKLKTLGVAMLLAAGTVGVAYATPVNLVSNGDFSQTQSPVANPTRPTGFGSLGSGVGGIYGQSGSCTTGDFITGWTGNSGYEIWYSSAAAASTVEPCAYYHGETQVTSPISAPPSGAGSGSFVGMDGISSPVPNASISQTVNGLIAGHKYTVSFYWGNTQLLNRQGNTTEYLKVSLGNSSQDTVTNSIGTHGWSGWAHVSMTFIADSTSDVLSFLSIGTPNSLPPFAVLTGVSMHAVPEPPELALFGGGLLGLGLLTVFARRRALRKQDGNLA